MCVIMAQPAGVTIKDSVLEAGWWTNPDGGGIGYIKGGAVVIEKGFMQLGNFMDAKRRLDLDGKPALFHFRIRTHGLGDAERTHPFNVEGNAVAHNGIISCVEDDDVLSDTQIFLARYPKIFSDKERLKKNKESLATYIGWSKLAVMFPDGEFVFVNESMGKWIDGAWYSNTYWKAATSNPRTSLA